MENLAISPGFWRNKKVFITGHTGFKGSWLCIWLHSLGASITGYALAPPTEPNLFTLARVHELIDSRTGDIRDQCLLSGTLAESAAEIVIHMAAQPLVKESYRTPVDTFSTNVMGTVHMLEAVRNCRSVKAVVNVTTDKCYENREWIWGYRENEPLGGFDPYSSSKACSELVSSAYRNSYFNSSDFERHGVALATARAGNVIGGGDWAPDRLIPDCLNALLAGRPIHIRNPRAIRPWQHVLEPLSGYLMLARKLYEEGPSFAEPWNFGPSDEDARHVEWIVQRICELWGDQAGYEIDDSEHPHEAHYLQLDCSKAHLELNWHPKWNLAATLDSIIEWTKACHGGKDIRPLCLEQIKRYAA